MPGFYIVKRYFFTVNNYGSTVGFWMKTPHWNPVRYSTWGEAADAYIAQRLGNPRIPGIPGYPPQDIDIRYFA